MNTRGHLDIFDNTMNRDLKFFSVRNVVVSF